MFSASKTAGPSGYNIQRSVRLRASATAYFSRTPATSTNQRTWTWSGWVKIGNGTDTQVFGAATSTSNVDMFTFGAAGVSYYSYFSAAYQIFVQSTAVFRDPSAWYHVVLAVDTTQATSTNRVKIYVNGVQQSLTPSYGGYGTQNLQVLVNSTIQHNIGRYPTYTAYFDGYLTEINFIDGQALTPSSFGAYNNYGVWSPAKYTGTYGTNGFYLNFQDNSAATAAAIGKDSSGNGNNWTPNNISVTAGVTYDSMTDVPTLTSATQANYCTFNPLVLRYVAGTTFSEANLKATGSSSYAWGTMNSGLSGKWYWEMTITAGTSVAAVGVDDGIGQTSATNANFVIYLNNGQKTINATSSAYGASYTTGDVIGVALNMDSGSIEFYKNNASQGVISNSFTAGVLPHVECGGSWAFQANFGQRPFTYTPPTGFNCLCTYNLATPTIPNGAAQMAATLYTGNGTTQSISNGNNNTIGKTFQPDLVWIKSRSAATDHKLTDSVRGATKAIISDTTGAQTTDANGLTAFGTTGFTIGTDTTYNNNTATYVAWQWKKTSVAGFDIISQTLSTTGINTITHSLGVVPTMVIAKRTDSAEAWLVYQSAGTTQSQYLSLNSTAAVATSANLWGSSAFTSSQFYFNGTSGTTYVFYVFAPVRGYSAFGSYTGNGSTDGPFVYCGFRPRWVLIKSSSFAAGWAIWDTSRNTYNVVNNLLLAESSSAELSYPEIDILSNGFKLRGTNSTWNGSSNTYIFAAFAENPFNYSLAR